MYGRLKLPTANIKGININYSVEGEGYPLILICGLGAVKGLWRSQTRLFKKYYRTITFNNRGSGKSDKPAGPYTIKMMADDTVGLMDHLCIEKAHVLGESMGGMIAQEIAITYPERVDKLVLACTYAGRDGTSGFTPEINAAADTYEKSSRDEASVRKYGRALMSLVFNKWYSRTFLVPLVKRLPISTKGMAGQIEACSTHDATSRIGMIKAPTLVITGTEDRAINPVSSEVIADLVPKAKLVKVKNGSHTFSKEMKDEFNKEVLDFLTNNNVFYIG